MTDSSTGGYLVPTSGPAIPDDQQLLNFFQAWIAGITGLNSTLVRADWQTEPPNIPVAGSVWCAFRIEDTGSDDFPAIVHNYGSPDADPGSDTLFRNESFDVVCSFFGLGSGSEARQTAKQLRDGSAIAQNREPLTLASMGLIACSAPVPAPSLDKGRWNYRCDMRVGIRRVVQYTYPILNIAEVEATIETQSSNLLTNNVTVEEPS